MSAPNVAVLITDGYSNDEAATWNAAMATRDAGIDIVVVGVGDHVKRRELLAVASDPVERNVFVVAGFDELDTVVSRVRDNLCNGERH